MMPDTLVGVWPSPATLGRDQAHQEALLRLAEMCAEHDVMPIGDSHFALIDERQDVLIAAHELGVSLPYLLDLCERVGFHKTTVLVAASVPVSQLFKGRAA